MTDETKHYIWIMAVCQWKRCRCNSTQETNLNPKNPTEKHHDVETGNASIGLLLAGEGEDNLDMMMGARLKIDHCRKMKFRKIPSLFPATVLTSIS